MTNSLKSSCEDQSTSNSLKENASIGYPEAFGENIAFIQNHTYYSINYSGDYSLEGMVTLGEKLVNYYKETGHQYALVDISNAKGNLSIMDRYHMADLMRDRWSKELCVSFIVNTTQIVKVLGFFWQKMAKHNGFKVNLEFDEGLAKAWLLEEIKQNQTA